MSAQIDVVHVGPQPGGYDVVIGSRDVPPQVDRLLGDRVRRVLVIHAVPVAELAQRLADVLAARDIEVHLHAVPDGEAAKTAAVAAQLWSVLGAAGFTRSDAVVGVGGGAVTDLAGFVAATWLRGVAVVQVPTTLLAMVDAAVGGKTGINTAEGKNLVGSFHEPVGVLVDLSSLRTLALADLVAGMGEIVKGGFIEDPRILELIEADPKAALNPDSPELRELVVRKIALKARVVTADLRESDLREILNYGHTFAHAVEQVSGYRRRHGEAVALGMVYAARLAQRAGRLDDADVERHRRVLETIGLPTTYEPPAGATWRGHFAAMRRDKKTRGDLLRFVVLDGIGRPGRLEGPSEADLHAVYDSILA
ncbi:MAG: 3-dehydroquinate synthase [Micrococcales bacterium]|nr:3-dehydroquinate synthase [Micrococcales bacterium]